MIENYKKEVEKKLAEYFDMALQKKEFKLFKDVIEAMKYTTCLGGKRLRAIFCLEAAKIFSGDYKAAIPSACAIEMLHAQSLIHDDLPCMDNDDLRRGKPSNHKVFGEAIATLAGDALISFGPQIIIENGKNLPPERILRVIKEFMIAAGAFGIVGGQTADIEAENSKTPISLEHLQTIHKLKTGALFKFSLIAGGIIGGADENGIEALEKFGEKFGLAFQIRDDILDVISTKEELGKTTGKDENSNKSTYVTIFGLDEAKEKLNRTIQECYDILDMSNLNSDVLKEITAKLGQGV